MWSNLCLAVIGSCLGVVVAGGTQALILALGIVVRYVRLTKTSHRISLYEDCAMLGALLGSLWGLLECPVPIGYAGVVLYGFFTGFFLGGWIVALGEVLNVYAIMLRRLKVTRGIGWIFFVMAIGKVAGILLFYGKGWWKL